MESISANLTKMLTTGDNLSAMSKSVGGDQNAVRSAVGMGIPIIMGSMANKASSPGGMDMLTGLMSKVGDSNPADNVGAYLNDPKAAGGSDMVSSLLGGQMGTVQNMISKKTGLPPAAVGQVLAMVTPIIVGQISKRFAGQKADPQAVSSFLGNESKAAMQSSPEAADLFKQFGTGQQKTGLMAKLKSMFGG